MSARSQAFSPRQDGAILSWFFVGGGLVLTVLLRLDEVAPWLPFLISIFAFGLAHGAADWLILRRGSTRRSLFLFLLYSAIGLVTALVATVSPALVIFGFFALTAVHFGTADQRDLESFSEGPANRNLLRYSGVVRMGFFLSLV
ncbi:MAG: Brp/Blh family beta-carotene 15,15'-dioxygenase, partial [Verrucomicrobiota bacterium]